MTKNRKNNTEETWRVFRIMAEFVDGFEVLSRVERAVSIFGSARAKPDDETYKLAYNVAAKLAKGGHAIITGAGPGVMEAANKGAYDVGGESIGLNIEIPIEQDINPYVKTVVSFRYFFCRKVMFAKYSSAFIVLPGGFGTFDEFFEGVTLIQTGRVPAFPVILVGSQYWKGLLDWLNGPVLETGKILKEELKIFDVADTPEEVESLIESFYK